MPGSEHAQKEHENADLVQARRTAFGPGAPGLTPLSPWLAANRRAADVRLGAAHDPAEAEAERVGRQIARFLGGTLAGQQPTVGGAPAAPGAGQRLDPDLAAELPAAGGAPLPPALRQALETALAEDFSGVRVYTSPQADGLNQALGARAFTYDQGLYFRQGEYDPAHPAGRAVIAHELAHVRQQRRYGPRLQRLMTGAYLRETLPPDPDEDTYKHLLALLDRYADMTAHFNLRSYGEEGNSTKYQEFMDLLEKIEQANQAWKEKFPKPLSGKWKQRREISDRVQHELIRERVAQGLIFNDQAYETDEDNPEMNWAQALFAARSGVPPSQVLRRRQERGNVQPLGGGARTPVEALDYQVGQNIQRKVFKPNEERANLPSGMSGVDERRVNTSARVMAGARVFNFFERQLAQPTNLLGQADFAVHDGRIGTATDFAPGQDAQYTVFKSDEEGRKLEQPERQDYVNLDLTDPELQRQMANLQLLDVLSGQLDRHIGNINIAQQAGQPTLVRGIDNDFAFDPRHTTSKPKGKSQVPPFVDRELAQVIADTNEGQYFTSLAEAGLDPDEQLAAMQRFREVRKKLLEMREQGRWLYANQEALAAAQAGQPEPENVPGGNAPLPPPYWGQNSAEVADRYDYFGSLQTEVRAVRELTLNQPDPQIQVDERGRHFLAADEGWRAVRLLARRPSGSDLEEEIQKSDLAAARQQRRNQGGAPPPQWDRPPPVRRDSRELVSRPPNKPPPQPPQALAADEKPRLVRRRPLPQPVGAPAESLLSPLPTDPPSGRRLLSPPRKPAPPSRTADVQTLPERPRPPASSEAPRRPVLARRSPAPQPPAPGFQQPPAPDLQQAHADLLNHPDEAVRAPALRILARFQAGEMSPDDAQQELLRLRSMAQLKQLLDTFE